MGDSHSPNYNLAPSSFNDQQTSYNYNISMLYCGFFVVATAGLVLAIYHCLALNWCSDYPPVWLRTAQTGPTEQQCQARKVIEFNSIRYKYKKGEMGTNNEECVVCLSGFEEEEDIRKLVKCKHSFHALCIDMWLFSHFDCPLCRAPVAVAVAVRSVARLDSSGSELSDSANLV